MTDFTLIVYSSKVWTDRSQTDNASIDRPASIVRPSRYGAGIETKPSRCSNGVDCESAGGGQSSPAGTSCDDCPLAGFVTGLGADMPRADLWHS